MSSFQQQEQSSGGKPLVARWSDLAAGNAPSSASMPVVSLADLVGRLDKANSEMQYQRQIIASLQAKVCLVEKEMIRLMEDNDFLMKCVQDPDFPQRMSSRQTIQQLRKLQEARKVQVGKIQPVYRPG